MSQVLGLLLLAGGACQALETKLRRADAVLTTEGEPQLASALASTDLAIEAVIADMCGGDAACVAQRQQEWEVGRYIE